jgi:hypothetical protein
MRFGQAAAPFAQSIDTATGKKSHSKRDFGDASAKLAFQNHGIIRTVEA